MGLKGQSRSKTAVLAVLSTGVGAPYALIKLRFKFLPISITPTHIYLSEISVVDLFPYSLQNNLLQILFVQAFTAIRLSTASPAQTHKRYFHAEQRSTLGSSRRVFFLKLKQLQGWGPGARTPLRCGSSGCVIFIESFELDLSDVFCR